MSSIDSPPRSPSIQSHSDDRSYSRSPSPLYVTNNARFRDDSRGGKRVKPDLVDRISNLPDALITHILSLMPTDEAVRTQRLSKRWRYAWASTPVLTFSPNRYGYDHKYINFISSALMSHQGKLKSLSLLIENRTRGYVRIEQPITLWIQCAVNKRIEILVLDLYDYSEDFILPASFFVCDSLREFSFRYDIFDLGSSVYWKSLKKLSLEKVFDLDNYKIDKIIEGSPELETMKLTNCSSFDWIEVPSNSKLRNLVINNYDFNEVYEGFWLDISGPSLTSLEISGCMEDMHCRLGNVSSLVKVRFGFRLSTLLHYEEDDGERSEILERCKTMMLQLLQKTSHVEILSLGTWCTQVVSILEGKSEPTILSLKCKTLEFDTLFEKDIPGIARLLRSSPYLEKLTIHMKFYSGIQDQVISLDYFSESEDGNYWKSAKSQDWLSFVKNPWPHLKVVQFIGSFHAMERKLMTELAEYVLGHAKVLDKLVLKPNDSSSVYRRSSHSDLRKSSLFCVMQQLLSYPRRSHRARVLLV